MKIAILGLGTVGSGVDQIIAAGQTGFTQALEVSKIFVRPSKVDLDPRMTANYDDILNDSSIELVVETLGGLEPSHDMIVQALKHGKNVVTANKAVVARHIQEFTQLAKANHVKFYFESAVGGGIPWIINLERTLRIDEIDSIHGIFNGTSNFILDQMTKTGASFESILKEAQDLGYAEADPSADIDGYDIENKLCISVDIAYDTVVEPGDELLKFGIRNVTAADIAYFKAHGWVVKLLGRSFRKNNRFSFVIEPTLFAPGQIEAGVHDNYNYVGLRGTTIGKLTFNGQGAGMFPTAHALVQDIIDVAIDQVHLPREFNQTLQLDNATKSRDYIVRTPVDLAKLLPDYQVTQDGDYWLVKNINTAVMHQTVAQLDGKPFLACINGGSRNESR
ncbi:homoserine dehydrogenase [Fructilactobacillus frigidiflavus]|uniref:homoserine dehydrogenase n=1 Tax=Fructilactobacillus frigidiflavus TaxID=3242688 RepID=UPI0037568658